MRTSKALQEKVNTLEDYIGIYNTIKGSLVKEGEKDKAVGDFTGLEFFGDNSIKSYDIDSMYIDKLLGNYSSNNKNLRNYIEKALHKMNKPEVVINVYHKILSAIDSKEVSKEEDILTVKRRFITDERNKTLYEFSKAWFVSLDELYTSAIQYVIGAEKIPNIGSILDKTCFDDYSVLHPDEKKPKYLQDMKRKWRKVLDNIVVPLDNELR